MQRNWVESEATWNQYASAAAWSVPGGLGTGDRGTTVLGQASANTTGSQSTSLNADGVEIVQAWVDGATPNYGFILADSASGDGLDFWSSDAPTAANRPRLSIVYRVPVSDADSDGIPDSLDNCIGVPNGTLLNDAGGNSQLDSNGDGYGNACDADLNNDGIINGLDVGPFISEFGTAGPDADFNGDGIVNGLDVGPFVDMFGQGPGPSGTAP
jgi:hypothetical protein